MMGTRAVCLWAAVVGVSCGSTKKDNDKTTDPTFEVSVPASLAECENDDDCEIVEPRCSNCCGAAAVAVAEEQAFFDHKASQCEDYTGGECNCLPPEVTAACDAGRCVVVE